MLRIGTDCSGIESPIEALKQLNINFKHVFSSEIDENCKKSLFANFQPEIFFPDMTKRKIEDVPDIDLYVCGFPCQPFSHAGNRKGFEDKRGNIFFHSLDIIKNKNPKYFILENVKGLITHENGKTWKIILDLLKETGYNIHYSVLNTKDYGIPQNRERLFIVGTKGEFSFPKKEKLKNLKSFVDKKDNNRKKTSERHEAILKNIPPDSIFVEFAFGVSKERTFVNANKICPCITANPRIWCVPKHRYANIKELLSLQGFSDFKQVVSDTQMKKQIGNSMSVNVLKKILENLLKF